MAKENKSLKGTKKETKPKPTKESTTIFSESLDSSLGWDWGSASSSSDASSSSSTWGGSWGK